MQAAGLSQATRTQRRLYVGGLPNPCFDYQLQTFLNQALVALGLCRSTGKMPIIQCTVRLYFFLSFQSLGGAVCVNREGWGLAVRGLPLYRQIARYSVQGERPFKCLSSSFSFK